MARPQGSITRKRLIEVLAVIGRSYGYELWKYYIENFPKTTLRNIFYNLKKGLAIGEFIIDKAEKKEGEFSWGSTTERIYYKLGPNARPAGELKINKPFSIK